MSETITKIVPSTTFVLAKPEKVETRTKSGLFLPPPSGNDNKPGIAIIVAVGPDVESYKAGDKIIYREYSQQEIAVDGDNYYIFDQEEILATITGGDK